jgi:Family of unknown function (DUF6544)
MIRILSLSLAVIAILHGLIHVMGFVAYWPLAKVPDLAYKTSLLGGRLEIGPAGMRLFSLLWLLAALGWVVAGGALIFKQPAWAPVMLGATLLSLAICTLDWGVAFRGALIDLVYLAVLFVVFGLRMQPAPLPEYSAASVDPAETVPLPAGLPAPVERFYRLTYPDGKLPVYHTAVVSGRGTLRLAGVIFPTRYRFTHRTGYDYRHYFESTFYGYPVMKVNEQFIDGRGRLELPFGVVENNPAVNSAANQGLWAEMSVYPAAFLTDGRARWEAVDDSTARLHIPFGQSEQVFTVHFDAQTGRLLRMETLRAKDAKSGQITWTAGFTTEPAQNGRPATLLQTATWADEGSPWLALEPEDIVFNTNISDYIRQKGP